MFENHERSQPAGVLCFYRFRFGAGDDDVGTVGAELRGQRQAATFAFRAEGPTIGRDAGIDVGEHA